jgi:hypothetical protein
VGVEGSADERPFFEMETFGVRPMSHFLIAILYAEIEIEN